MGLVAEFEIGCAALPLVSVAGRVPVATLVVDIQYNHGRRPPFIVAATHDDHAAVEAALDEADFVAEHTLVGAAGDTRRYQVLAATSFEEQLGDHLDDLSGLRGLATTDAIVERIEATPSGWIQTGWFADRDAFDEFRAFWQDNATFSLRRLTRDGDPEPPGDGLTDPQREALRTAYEMGHFEVPRGASLAEVADEVGVGTSALSERLRRAQTRLVEETVASTWPPLPDGT